MVENVLSDTGTLIDKFLLERRLALAEPFCHSVTAPASIAQRCRCQSGGVSAADVALGQAVSIAMFCRNSMKSFCDAKKDVDDLLKRPDINWRGLNWLVARAVLDKTGPAGTQRAECVCD